MWEGTFSEQSFMGRPGGATRIEAQLTGPLLALDIFYKNAPNGIQKNLNFKMF